VLCHRAPSYPAGNAGSLRPASSYHLKEGRYFEAPLILKKQKKSKNLALLLLLGGSLNLIPSIKNLNVLPAVAETMPVTTLKRQDHIITSSGFKIFRYRHRVAQATMTRLEMRAAIERASQRPKVEKALIPPSFPQVAITPAQMRVALRLADPQNHITLTQMQADLSRTGKRLSVAKMATTQSAQLPESVEPEVSLAQIQIDLSRVSQRLSVATPLAEPEINLASMEVDLKRSSQKLKTIAPPPKPEIDLDPVLAFHLPDSGPLPQLKRVSILPVPDALAHLVTNPEPDILALAYAPTTIQESPFDGILTQQENRNTGRFIPPIGAKDHAWAANPLSPQAFTAKEQKCLAEAVYFEARGESLKGQAAVAQVVLNRVRNPAYPATICGVVYQNTNWRNRCQFSFACDGKKRRVTQPHHWKLAQDIARTVTSGQIWLPEVGSSTHYHATYVRPRWARSMIKLEKIGLHIFYRTRYGGWS